LCPDDVRKRRQQNDDQRGYSETSLLLVDAHAKERV
jgi:hypothetical protein